jgi:hypothetical protein
MDGAPACPFVAFGDDRDGRSTSPDHRHRCFAESPPAPRALAHQEAYCLSSAFPVCPTFQDWARREAAHARGGGDEAETAPTAVPTSAPAPAPDLVPQTDPPAQMIGEPPVRRNPPRDWAAPPPWAGGPSGRSAAAAASGEEVASEFLTGRSGEGQGLAGSAADRLAGGSPPSSAGAGPPVWSASAGGAASVEADGDLAGLVQPRSRGAPPAQANAEAYPPPTRTGRRPAVSSTRSAEVVPGPSWERLRHQEAYPSIRTRAGLPGLPRVAVLAGALVIAALALFMLPWLLGFGGGGAGASPTPGGSRASASPTAAATFAPSASQQTYTIKSKDTLLKVAKMFGITLEQLLAANPQITNPNVIGLGQVIVIPSKSASSSAAPSGSAAP